MSARHKWARVTAVAGDFEHFAAQYAKVIVSEIGLPARRRTVQPGALGGRAGGDKLVVRDVLFKFCTDRHGIYGSEELAAKAAGALPGGVRAVRIFLPLPQRVAGGGAGLELRGSSAVLQAQVPGVCVPLQCVVEFMGFRILAACKLPLRPRTPPIYGSSDGGMSRARCGVSSRPLTRARAGRTVRAEVPEHNEQAMRLGKLLNLAEHMAGVGEHPRALHLAVDVEGHAGEVRIAPPPLRPPLRPPFCPGRALTALGPRDGRTAASICSTVRPPCRAPAAAADLVAGARMFPPEHPLETQHLPAAPAHRSIFSRQLRPDLVTAWSQPLSADALTQFEKHDPNRVQVRRPMPMSQLLHRLPLHSCATAVWLAR